MRWFPWHFLSQFSRQHLTTMYLLAAVFAALVPIPISRARPMNEKDHSQPFPCKDRPCGCRTAEQCRKKCCCFTPMQKMGWAKRHGVKTFDVAVVDTKPNANPSAPRLKCCASTAYSKSHPSKTATDGNPHGDLSASVPRSRMVIGVIAQKCQGVQQSFAGLSIFILPPDVALESLIQPNGERLTLELVRFEQGVVEPPVPPPRIAV